jgi:phosphatidylinositol dimannoside acyltransferase
MRPVARLTYPAYRIAETAARMLPRQVLPGVSAAVATLAMLVMPQRRRLVRRHLGRVTARARVPTNAVWRAFGSYTAYWLDTFRLSGLQRHELESRLDPVDLTHLDRALAAGRGAILATGHLGSWDLGAAWLAAKGYRLVAVVERLASPRLLAWFREIRRRNGIEVVVRGPDVWDRLGEALAAQAVVVLVADRDLSGRGVEVDFFGERTTIPAGPARLARRTGAPLLPAAIHDLGGGRHRGVIRPPITVPSTGDERHDVSVASQRLVHELEDLISAAPEQWHLMVPNWPSDYAALGRTPPDLRKRGSEG